MKAEIQQLEDHLKTSRLEYYQELKAPLTEKEITDLEIKYKVVLPADLKVLYLWKNGQAEDCYEAFVNNSMFESLETVLENHQLLTGMIGFDFTIENYWNKHWLPIFANGGGSYICYDLKGIFTNNKGQIIEFWNGDNNRTVFAPSLVHFLKSLTIYYQNTATEDFDDCFDISEQFTEWQQEFMVDTPL